MPTFSKCMNTDRSEASYLSAVFSIFAALSAICAVMDDQWIKTKEYSIVHGVARDMRTFENMTNSYASSRKMIPICSHIGASLFWLPHISEYEFFTNETSQAFASSFRLRNTIYINCISRAVAYLFYSAISLCFVIVIFSICAAALQTLLFTAKFLDWLRKCVVLEMCNVCIMFIVCLLTWQAKREVEFQLKTTEICIGRGVFYVICSGAYSSIAALFSVYQNHLVGRSRRAENQRFICTRALRSWRDHVESSRQIPSSRPTELERYLLGACPGTDTVSSLTILPTAGNNTES